MIISCPDAILMKLSSRTLDLTNLDYCRQLILNSTSEVMSCRNAGNLLKIKKSSLFSPNRLSIMSLSKFARLFKKIT